MKRNKKFIALLLSISSLFSFVACGPSNSQGDSSSSIPPIEETEKDDNIDTSNVVDMIVEDGESDYTIVYSAAASSAEQYAVSELSQLKTKVESLEAAVAGVKTDVSNVQAGLDDLAADVEGLAELTQTVESNLSAKGCGKNATALVFEIAGAAALLAFVLRKRH